MDNFTSDEEEEVEVSEENPRAPLSIKKWRFWKCEDNPFIAV